MLHRVSPPCLSTGVRRRLVRPLPPFFARRAPVVAGRSGNSPDRHRAWFRGPARGPGDPRHSVAPRPDGALPPVRPLVSGRGPGHTPRARPACVRGGRRCGRCGSGTSPWWSASSAWSSCCRADPLGAGRRGGRLARCARGHGDRRAAGPCTAAPSPPRSVADAVHAHPGHAPAAGGHALRGERPSLSATTAPDGPRPGVSDRGVDRRPALR